MYHIHLISSHLVMSFPLAISTTITQPAPRCHCVTFSCVVPQFLPAVWDITPDNWLSVKKGTT